MSPTSRAARRVVRGRIPAMPNVHSHAFQRDLRGIGERSESAADDFWSWREEMYRLAGALEPDSMREVAGRVYAEMAAAGYGAVGEFHYVHHRPDGTPYDEPNAMALAVAGGGRRRAAGRPAARRLPPRRPPPLPRPVGRRTTSRAWTRCGSPATRSASPPTASAPCRRMAARDRRVRRRARPRPPRPRARAAARAGGVPGRARLLADRAARTAPGSSPHRTTVVHGIHVERPRHRAGGRQRRHRGHLPDDRGQPRRRPLPGAALPRRRRAAGDRQRQQRRRRPVRGAARAGDRRASRAPHPARAAGRGGRPVGGVAQDGARLARARRRRRGGRRPRPPAAARRGRRGRHARARHVRLGRYGGARAPPDLVRLHLRGADRLLARRGRRRLGPRVRHDRLRLRDDDDLRRRGGAGRAALANVGAALAEAGARSPTSCASATCCRRGRLRGLLAGSAPPLRRGPAGRHDAGCAGSPTRACGSRSR